MAWVGVSKRIPFSEVFACAQGSDSPHQQARCSSNDGRGFVFIHKRPNDPKPGYQRLKQSLETQL